jgi:hypothetical protein
MEMGSLGFRFAGDGPTGGSDAVHSNLMLNEGIGDLR